MGLQMRNCRTCKLTQRARSIRRYSNKEQSYTPHWRAAYNMARTVIPSRISLSRTIWRTKPNGKISISRNSVSSVSNTVQEGPLHVGELFSDGNKFIKGEGFERLPLEVGVWTGFSEQVTAVGHLNKDDFWAQFSFWTALAAFREAISIREEALFGQDGRKSIIWTTR